MLPCHEFYRFCHLQLYSRRLLGQLLLAVAWRWPAFCYLIYYAGPSKARLIPRDYCTAVSSS
ncbi:hypothetical protein BO83DRAFT_14677 [Aspergillus eucalypticola CBS 122712]|uniref:Uncharacterized protein n=1 Tax=Aspergillus eucalypticola (strain CBS 122712 / IBT 29274) TaxID=1448314 RepID=A0A317VLN5_ASPEC|nr:uncharacterized protein BO83DRAFT_14677 [Aspergillus eucalypticola CBS 122712]PWY74755.1 hypothetical protein BO83DRAFT_14677 [Aspergillus eucalypticola CBS 122712]